MTNNLSNDELEILYNTEFLKLKISVLQKCWRLLDDTRYQLLQDINAHHYQFPERTDIKTGKISRGEFYKDLPYMVLDFPRLMKQDTIMAFRTMFWWGHYFSCTLHLQGEALLKFRNYLLESKDLIKEKEFYICVNDTPWEYHFASDNYQYSPDIEEGKFEKLLSSDNFIKLSKKLPITEWNSVPDFTLNTFHDYVNFLKL